MALIANLKANWKKLGVEALKGLAGVGVAFLAKWVVSPDVLNVVGTGNQWIVFILVIPALKSAEKYLGIKSALAAKSA